MGSFSLRSLTAREQALAAEVFGAALDAARVRVVGLPLWSRAFVAGPALMVWPARTARPDFGDPATPLALQATFVHELTHVWQAQSGVFLAWAKVRAGDGLAAYAYDLEAGAEFRSMNIEQQAMVVEHAFLAARGVAVQHPAQAYADLGQPWRRA